jgi:arsenate reductase (thioredoxin)
MAKAVPEVLFVCIHNAGRSQMAAALLDHHAQGRVVVRSAGSQAADQLNPAVVAAMAELGLDISREFPKPLTDEAVKASDARASGRTHPDLTAVGGWSGRFCGQVWRTGRFR